MVASVSSMAPWIETPCSCRCQPTNAVPSYAIVSLIVLGTAAGLDHGEAPRAQRTGVRLVGRDLHAHERLQRDVQARGVGAAVDDRTRPHHLRARGLGGVAGLARGQPR